MSAAQRFTSQLVTLALLSAPFGTVAAFENAPPPANTGGFGETDCSSCHFDNTVNADSGSLTIKGVPEVFEPGQRYALTVALDHPNLMVGGFQISVRAADGGPAGELTSADNDIGTATLSTTGVTYLQHNRPRNKSDTGVRWAITWRAPDDDVAAVINVAANAANGDASPLGDFIYKADVTTGSLAHAIAASGSTEAKTETRPHQSCKNEGLHRSDCRDKPEQSNSECFDERESRLHDHCVRR